MVDATPEEEPTQPDLARVTCPVCHGECSVLPVSEDGTSYSGRLRPCLLCLGQGRVDRAVHLDWQQSRS